MNNIEQWHELFLTNDLKKLNTILDKDVVFYSPLVFSPQKGRQLTSLYLKSAHKMFFADGNRSFQYVREIHSDQDSMLEFTCEIDGIQINGIDLIKWNANGKIVEFKVMIRPNKAIEKVKEKMSEIMRQLTPLDTLKLKAKTLLDGLRP